ncbi:hypothetical protein [Sphingorhabdus sp.]|uniref:hypothetical protein n=1 Tax=Sphingorhabdus sp. TaxID=1902408 RepID=UPI003D8131C8
MRHYGAKEVISDSTNLFEIPRQFLMGISNLQASLEKKYAAWNGELLDVQKQIQEIERSHVELSTLRARAARLEHLVANATGIFFEVNPEWNAEGVKPVRAGTYGLPFEIGTVSKDCMTILREEDKPMTSRQIAKMIVARHGLDSSDWELVQRICSTVDGNMRKRRDKHVKGEGEWPIYWSILPA